MAPGPFGPGAGARRGVPAEPLKGGGDQNGGAALFLRALIKRAGRPVQ